MCARLDALIVTPVTPGVRRKIWSRTEHLERAVQELPSAVPVESHLDLQHIAIPQHLESLDDRRRRLGGRT